MDKLLKAISLLEKLEKRWQKREYFISEFEKPSRKLIVMTHEIERLTEKAIESAESELKLMRRMFVEGKAPANVIREIDEVVAKLVMLRI